MARLFDNASNQRLLLGSAVLTAEPITLAGWCRPDETTDQAVVSISNTGTVDGKWTLQLRGGGTPDVSALKEDDSGSFDQALSSTTYSLNTWHHACAIFENNDRHAFLDGGGKGDNTPDITDPTADVTSIGVNRHSVFQRHFSGRLAEIGIWDVVLTDAQVLVLANGVSPLMVEPESLIAYWPLLGRYSPEIDLVGGFDMAVTGATAADHTRVFYPARSRLSPFAPTGDINTEAKRKSVAGIKRVFRPRVIIPDGSIDQANRQTIGWSYSGILAEAPAGAGQPFYIRDNYTMPSFLGTSQS